MREREGEGGRGRDERDGGEREGLVVVGMGGGVRVHFKM